MWLVLSSFKKCLLILAFQEGHGAVLCMSLLDRTITSLKTTLETLNLCCLFVSMWSIFNSTHYLWEPFFVDMVHHNYFMVTAGGRTSRAASKANYPFKLATAWNENKPLIYKQLVASKVLWNLCKKKKKSILGNKLQNQSLEHRYIPTKIQTPSRGFKKKAQEVEYHKLIIATLYN